MHTDQAQRPQMELHLRSQQCWQPSRTTTMKVPVSVIGRVLPPRFRTTKMNGSIREPGGRLVVPREEVGDDYSAGDELDLTTCLAAKIQKPSRHEWIRLFRDLELPTKLLIRKPTSDSMDEQYFYVAPKLRRDIEGDLKSVRVFPYYSLSARRWGLWVVKVTAGNSWYESLQALFTQDASFFKTRQIRVFSDKVKSAQYQVKHKELDRPVDDPPQPTSDLLGQALGDDHFIVDRQHPVYLSLVEGEELR